jgi:hypothetical protein
MPTCEFPRLTQSGACAACGHYPGILPHTCRQRTAPRLQLGPMRKAPVDARKSSAARRKIHLDNQLVRDR